MRLRIFSWLLVAVALGAGCSNSSAPACNAPKMSCMTGCIDVTTDNNNCGACATVCPPAQACSGGKCACPVGKLACGSGSSTTCVATSSDNMNCGACGINCPVGTSCVAGKCSCPSAKPNLCGMDTSAFCTDFMTDDQNCGMCGTKCAPGTNCVNGACACPMTTPNGCGTGTNAFCTNFMTDANNCGACGTTCPSGQICAAGKCECTGMTPDSCGTGSDQFCTNFKMDNNNCGACAMACPAGQVCSPTGCMLTCANLTPNMCTVSGMQFCTDLTSDAKNCGACGTMCAAGQACVGSKCVCPSGTPDSCGTGSAAICTHLQSDPSNCGTCGTKCPSAQGCNAGKCGCPTTTPNACTAASGVFCTNTQTDSRNCGACGTICAAGQSCVAGKCTCPSTTPNACGTGGTAFCTNTMSDINNCGACATVCGAMQSCTGGKCACPTASPNVCGTGGAATCTNFATDPANCGGCGMKCASGQVCAASQCAVGCAGGSTACPASVNPGLPNALEAFWAFEGNLADSTGHGFTAAGNAAYAKGYIGQSYTVAAPGVTAPNVPLAHRAFTVEGWLNGSDFSTDRAIVIECDSASTDNCLHLIVRGGKLYLGFYGDDLAAGTTITTNKWHHFAASYDPATRSQTLYLDGTKDGVRTSMADLGAAKAPLGIGGNGGNVVNVPAFAGSLDDIKIWEAVRSATDILSDAQIPSACDTLTSDTNNCGACNHACPIAATCASGACACPTATPMLCGAFARPRCFDATGDNRLCGACGVACLQGLETCTNAACESMAKNGALIDWWQFDGNLTNATGGPAITQTAGATGYAQAWAGTGDVVAANNIMTVAQAPNLTTSFTIETWVLLTAVANTDYWIYGWCDSLNVDKCLHVVVRNGHPYMGFYNDDTQGASTLAANKWTHLAFSYDAGTKTRTIYVNGVLDGSSTAIANLNVPLTDGAYVQTRPPIANWGGSPASSLDELKVFNYARTAGEIKNDATVLAYYTFDGAAGTTDLGPNRHNGAVSGAVTYAAGAYGKSAFTDGINATFTAPLPQLGVNIPFTVELWVDPASPGVILNESDKAPAAQAWFDTWLDLASDGTLYASIWHCPAISSGKLPFNVWNHVAMTYDTATLTVYVNGVAVGNEACARTTPSTAGVAPVYSLGMADSTFPVGGSPNFMKGGYDELRWYSRALTAAEIALEATH